MYHGAMPLETSFQIVFAVGVAVASAALAAAGFRLVRRVALVCATAVVSAAAVAAWIAFALRPDRELAISAGGLTGAAVAAAGSLALARALRRAAQIDAELARARADSISLLAEQERRIAEERRTMVIERERSAGAELTEALARTQKQVEQRLQDWGQDLERSAEALRARLVEVGQRQRKLMADAEARIAADAERLQAESEEQ